VSSLRQIPRLTHTRLAGLRACVTPSQESKNFALRKLYNTMGGTSLNNRKNALRATRSVPVLLVDGYNILHVWEKTKPLMEEGELEEVRRSVHVIRSALARRRLAIVCLLFSLDMFLGRHEKFWFISWKSTAA
jgi:hypothetical protein